MKIRSVFILVLMAGLLVSSRAQAQQNKFGIGAIFGEPTGLSAKYFLKERVAIDVGLAYSFFESFIIYGDGLWHFPAALAGKVPELAPLTPYLGIGTGIRIISKDKPDHGDARANMFIRFPFGLDWNFSSVPLAIFAEIAPGLGIIPKVFGIFQGGIGLRYYF